MKHNLMSISLTIIALLFISSLNAQDTLFVSIHKTILGCDIQGPTKDHMDYYRSRGTSFPVISYNCGSVPDLNIGSLLEANHNFTGIIFGKWYWKSDNSDSLYLTNLVQVKSGKVTCETKKHFQFYTIHSEWIKTDSTEIKLKYQSAGKIASKEIIYPLPIETAFYNQVEICSAKTLYFDDDERIIHQIYYCGDTIFEELYEYADSKESLDSVPVVYLLKNNLLIDIFNAKCLFVDRKGKVLEKDVFLRDLSIEKISGWESYSLIEEDKTECVDLLITEDGFDIWDQRKFERLKKKMKCY